MFKKTVQEYLLDLRLFTKFIYAMNNEFPINDEIFEKLDISVINEDFFQKITTEQI